MKHQDQTGLSVFFKEIKDILNKPVPLPEVLTTPIFETKKVYKPKRKPLPDTKSPEKKRPQQFTLEGLLKVGTNTEFSISGEDFSITPETWIVGDVEYGKQAKVFGVSTKDGRKKARKVTILG